MVLVRTPQHLRSEEVVKTAEPKKQLLIEKPVATALEYLRTMRDSAKKSPMLTILSVIAMSSDSIVPSR